MRIVVAPDSFKEALVARAVCEAITRGIRRVLPDAVIDAVPMADGGEGTVDALVSATGGELRHTEVTGPLGGRAVAAWGVLGDGSGTAVLEMAAASGLGLVPVDERDPARTTTFGTGELIRAALDSGAGRILIGIGGSATCDGGAGAAQAAGVSFLDARGRRLSHPLAGGDLRNIDRIDMRSRDPRIPATRIVAACDVENPLCGEQGAAAVFGPQKGATPQQVRLLDEGLGHLADVVQRDLGCDIRDMPGAGAAGGLGAGLVAFFGAKLQRGIEMVMQAVQLAERIRQADLVITGEGRIDRQSMMGKVIAGVAGAARQAGVPAIALVGCVGEGADETLAVLRSYHPINPPGMPLSAALPRTAAALEETTARVLKHR